MPLKRFVPHRENSYCSAQIAQIYFFILSRIIFFYLVRIAQIYTLLRAFRRLGLLNNQGYIKQIETQCASLFAFVHYLVIYTLSQVYIIIRYYLTSFTSLTEHPWALNVSLIEGFPELLSSKRNMIASCFSVSAYSGHSVS